MPAQKVAARVDAIIREAREVKTFRFALEGGSPIAYLPGQYLQITVPVPDGRREFTRRSFTISSSPTEPGCFQITVKRNLAGTVSNFLHDRLREGDRLELLAPFGQFTLREGEARRLCLIGGGSGVTPIRAILRAVVDQRLPVEARLLYLNRCEEDIIFHQEFLEMAEAHPGIRARFALTDPPPGWTGPTGRISPELLDSALEGFTPDLVFLCGPPPMMELTMPLLTARGIDRDRIRTEKFK
jgi:ferredoxin-NADP reductase